MTANDANERSLVIIKPDGIQRSLMGEIISRYERAGLKLVAMKMMQPTADLIEKHYTLDPEWLRLTGEKSLKSAAEKGNPLPEGSAHEIGTRILTSLKKYLTCGPVIAMVWQGVHAVAIIRKLTGGTEPLTSQVGTIRGDFVLDSYQFSNDTGRAIRNLVHASGTPKEANDEISHWFAPSELMNYRHVQEAILYEVDFDAKH